MSDEVKATETAAPAVEPVKAEPASEPVQTPKERVQEIAAELRGASPSRVETLAGELAELAAGL